MGQGHLAYYLNDHLAGSVVAIHLLEHLEAVHRDDPLTAFLAALRADILVDRQELEAVLARLQVGHSLPRKGLAWMTEKLTELKLHLDDSREGPLRRLEALEMISVGIEGKRLLWRALDAAGVSAPPGGYARLIQRAEEQRGRVEVERLIAARTALSPPPADEHPGAVAREDHLP